MVRLFSGLENSLEKYIEGFFKDKFSTDAKVQPMDVAKKLARAMRDKRKVSVANVYVPNEYTIFLNGADFNTIKPMEHLLVDELADYLIKKAAEKNFTLVSRPRIEFSESTEVEQGDIVVETDFGAIDSIDIDNPKEGHLVRDTDQNTRNYHPLSDTTPIPILKKQVSAVLIVEEGTDVGKEYALDDHQTSVGRRDACDIVINDTSISRRHAQFEKTSGRFWVVDLNSTNGTFVNGLPIEKVELNDGDVITLGKTVLIFKEF